MRLFNCFIILFSVLITTSSSIGQGTLPDDTRLGAEIDKIMSDRFKSTGVGATILVSKKGNVILKKGYGMADLESNVPASPESVFRIASLTKQFTAVAILQLSERQLLSVKDDIRKYIPDFPSTKVPITVENLLTHTSGIRNNTEMKFPDIFRYKNSTPSELVDLIEKEPLEFEPGASFRYSNSGYILLGYILEKVSGSSYEEYITEHIFKPLGMDHSYFDRANKVILNRANGYFEGPAGQINNANFLNMTFAFSAGGLMTAVEDMYKWHKGLRQEKILKKETLEKALTPYALQDGSKSKYGYGWDLNDFAGSKAQMHSGNVEGFSCFQVYLPTDDVYVVILSNSGNKNTSTPSLIAASIATNKVNMSSIDLPPSIFNKYIGKYKFPDTQNGIVTISLDNGKMMFRDSHASGPWEMHFTTPTDFYCDEVYPNNHSFTMNKYDEIDGFLIISGAIRLKIERIP